jgi:molecular chaperone GrpE
MTARKKVKKEVDVEADIEFYAEEVGGLSTGGDAQVYEIDAAIKKIEKLKKELKECKLEKQEYLDGWQRLRADVANKKRDDAELGKLTGQNAKLEIIESILPVLDSFEMAFSGESWRSVDSAWRGGVEHIHSQLEGVLLQNDIQPFAEVGDDFDPTLHEAIEEVDTNNEKDDGKLASVLRRGYKFGDKILRPAQVKIIRLKS